MEKYWYIAKKVSKRDKIANETVNPLSWKLFLDKPVDKDKPVINKIIINTFLFNIIKIT